MSSKQKFIAMSITFLGWIFATFGVYMILVALFPYEFDREVTIPLTTICGFWLSAIISIIILFRKRMIWHMSGILAAVIFNIVANIVMMPYLFKSTASVFNMFFQGMIPTIFIFLYDYLPKLMRKM